MIKNRKVINSLLLKTLGLEAQSENCVVSLVDMILIVITECIYGDKKVSITDLASGSGSLLINIAALVKRWKRDNLMSIAIMWDYNKIFLIY